MSDARAVKKGGRKLGGGWHAMIMDNVLLYMVSLRGSDRPAVLEDLTPLHT